MNNILADIMNLFLQQLTHQLFVWLLVSLCMVVLALLILAWEWWNK